MKIYRVVWLFGMWGCSVVPQVYDLQVIPSTCGRWDAEISANGWFQQLQLSVDQRTVQTWALQGDHTFHAVGMATPGKTAQFQAMVGDSSTIRTVMFSPIEFRHAIVPEQFPTPANKALILSGPLIASCPTLGTTWSARVDTGEWSLSAQSWPPDGNIHLSLPPLPPGVHQVLISVQSVTGTVTLTPIPVLISAPTQDQDGDNYENDVDCNDQNPEIHPNAIENSTPNGHDDNCNGLVDEGTRVYDDDGDRYSEQQGDCDDEDFLVYPNANELADCRDQNCNDQIDEGVSLVQKDDIYEPNDLQERAYNLRTEGQNSFVQTLWLVSRDRQDQEWIEFYSQDGLLDSWGIDVSLKGAPTAVYDVEIYPSQRGVVAKRIVGDDVVEMTGHGLSDDSGIYQVRISPVSLPQFWCPVQVEIVSR